MDQNLNNNGSDIQKMHAVAGVLLQKLRDIKKILFPAYDFDLVDTTYTVRTDSTEKENFNC